MGNLKKLLLLADSQIGYQEKRSNARLDDPDANAGRNNYTKYARDVNNWGLPGCQGQPWCATYQFWLEAQTFGVETALEHFHMKRDSYQGYNCFCIYDAFERAGRTSSVPMVGSLIVFKHSHIGRVTAVKNSRLFTNEGNTSALYGDSNGGTVKNKDYALDDANILGYCRMDYADGQETDGLDEAETDKPYLPRRRVEEFQKWMNTWYPELIRDWCGDLLKEDGVFGVMTKKAAIIVWKDVLNRLYGCELDLQKAFFDDGCRKAAGKAVLRNGSGGTLTAIAEGLLASRGIYKGNIDAMFGNAMEAAVMEFQRKQSLLADGIIGKRTWEKLLL